MSNFGINGICKNPNCAESFHVAEQDNPLRPRQFPSIEEAQEAIGMIKTEPGAGFLAAHGLKEQSQDLFPKYTECGKCNAIFPREDLEYFAVRLLG